jgi:hypothetical protein
MLPQTRQVRFDPDQAGGGNLELALNYGPVTDTGPTFGNESGKQQSHMHTASTHPNPLTEVHISFRIR